MTDEELKKEAEEWLCNNLHFASEEDFIKAMVDIAEPREKRIVELEKENVELKQLVEKYRQAVDKCLHITFIGGGEVHTIAQYAALVDKYLIDVEGLSKWKN